MVEKAQEDERMTVDAFLEWDDGTDTRYELIDGRVVAMNPSLAPHARLLSQVVAALVARMPPGCGVYTGGGTVRPLDNWNYRIPDVTVSCRTSRQHWVEEPRLVCEVLSPSTARADLTSKLDFYRSLQSIELILVLYVAKRQATLWRRDGEQWVVRDFIGSALLDLPVTTWPIPLDELYAPLSFPEDEASGDPA
jgi:Uma2 family endonuclease